jgi:hypothetical protein
VPPPRPSWSQAPHYEPGPVSCRLEPQWTDLEVLDHLYRECHQHAREQGGVRPSCIQIVHQDYHRVMRALASRGSLPEHGFLGIPLYAVYPPTPQGPT